MNICRAERCWPMCLEQNETDNCVISTTGSIAAIGLGIGPACVPCCNWCCTSCAACQGSAGCVGCCAAGCATCGPTCSSIFGLTAFAISGAAWYLYFGAAMWTMVLLCAMVLICWHFYRVISYKEEPVQPLEEPPEESLETQVPIGQEKFKHLIY